VHFFACITVLHKNAFFGQKMPTFGAHGKKAPTQYFQTKLSPFVGHIKDIKTPK